jgi:hypothetical protein
VNAFLALFAYTTGFVAFETARTPGERDAKQRAQALRLYAALSDEDFPSTRALARCLAKRPGDLEFTRGLHGVIAGSPRTVRGPRSPGRRQVRARAEFSAVGLGRS